jgi:hypothetical protein
MRYRVEFYLKPDANDQDMDAVAKILNAICVSLQDGLCVKAMPTLVSVSAVSTNPFEPKTCDHGWLFVYHFKKKSIMKSFAEIVSYLRPVCAVSYYDGKSKVCVHNEWVSCLL